MIKFVIDAVLGAVIGGIAAFLTDLRREEDLKKLGYTQAQRDIAKTKLKDVTRYATIEQMRPRSFSDISHRLRSHAERVRLQNDRNGFTNNSAH